VYFPVAGIEVSPWIPPLVAFAISLFTSMGGVSGAFLLVPFQASVLGFHSPAMSATNHLFNILAIPSGVWRYRREGRMVWPVVWIVTLGTLPGVLLGVLLRIHWLADPEAFKLFVGIVLLYIGGQLALELIRKKNVDRHQDAAEEQFWKSAGGAAAVSIREFSARRLAYDFCGQAFEIRTLPLALLCLAVGIIGGIYGIGGGSIIAPLLIAFFGMPVYIAAGAALMATFVTSLAGVTFYQLLAPWYPHLAVGPDWGLGLLFGLGGMAGMYCGARLQKFVRARIVKTILAICILVPALGYLRAPLRSALPFR
jgi:uncharacterized membrane protein YfcA